MPTFVAVDLGATSGRVVNVRIDRDGFELDVVRRFPTFAVAGSEGDLTWDFDALLNDVTTGLAEARMVGAAASATEPHAWHSPQRPTHFVASQPHSVQR